MSASSTATSPSKGDSSELRLPRVPSPHAHTSAAPPLPPTPFADVANPFLVPTTDVFSIKAKEAVAKAANKKALSSLKVWDKPARPSSLTSPASSPTPSTSSYLQRRAARNAFLASSSSSSASHSSKNPSAAADSPFYPSSLPHTEKLNMSSFITQKRDMFLLHMSLATKRSEITKLEEKAAMKEEALRKSEQMLEEDAMRFDAFLKENDRRAHESLKRADRESKDKNEKVVEIKKINAEIGKVEAEMSKYEEQLHNCLKYKQFLDQLTDPAFLAAEERRKAEWTTERVKRKEEKKKQKMSKQRSQLDSGGSLTSQRGPRGTSGRVNWRSQMEEKEGVTTGGEGPSDSDSDSDGEVWEERMYFTSPQQLLDLFSQLEERNLFLIQNVQETEESLEEMKGKYTEMESEMNEKSSLLLTNIEEMKKKIEKEKEKTLQLQTKKAVMGMVGDMKGEGMDVDGIVGELHEQVKAVYKKSGFDGDTQTDTLDMLRDIEGWLAHLLNEMKSMDPVKVEAAEKRKNAERRTLIRQAKKEEQQRLYEERLAKSTARASAEVVRHTGKPVMARSAPLKKKVQEENVQQVDEEAEELKRYFT